MGRPLGIDAALAAFGRAGSSQKGGQASSAASEDRQLAKTTPKSPAWHATTTFTRGRNKAAASLRPLALARDAEREGDREVREVEELLHHERPRGEPDADEPLGDAEPLGVDLKGVAHDRGRDLHQDHLHEHRADGNHEVQRILRKTSPDLPLAAQEPAVVLVGDLEQHERVEEHGVVLGLLPRGDVLAVVLQVGDPLVAPEQAAHEADLVARHADDVGQHPPGDDGVVAVHGGALQQLVGRGLRRQRDRRCGVHDEVQPQQVQNRKGRLLVRNGADHIDDQD
mmetsp:Transcript_114838/g.319398  ORF Transcript_114838/g.319398 Transcript_114838/m.319398 type:complete len:283 (+) Transcript_114838:151-999(+)